MIIKRTLVATGLSFFLASCQAPSAIDNTQEKLTNSLNSQWQSQWQAENQLAERLDNDDILSLSAWLTEINDPQLNGFIEQALLTNRQLKAQYFSLQASKQNITVADATNWPDISLGLKQSRVKNSQGNINNSAELGVQLSYELDLWGKLSSSQQQQYLNFASNKMAYQQAVLTLVADVTKAWFNVIEAQQLLQLYQERAQNLLNNLAQIKAAYRLGLNQALDVYLVQNNVHQEQARVIEQQENLAKNNRIFTNLLGQYPQDKLATLAKKSQLPHVNFSVFAGTPTDIITRRSDLNQAWYNLLSFDAALAVAHKQKFPSITLSANLTDSTDQLNNLLDGGPLAWSLIGNLTSPLFNAGKLEARKQQAFFQTKQQEQLYLDQVFNAFIEVENGLTSFAQLQIRQTLYQQALDNAEAAEKLAFDQYLKGLVDYTTVLEAQRRAFDAQTTLIQLAKQVLFNQLNLSVALGGDIPKTLINSSGINNFADIKTENE